MTDEQMAFCCLGVMSRAQQRRECASAVIAGHMFAQCNQKRRVQHKRLHTKSFVRLQPRLCRYRGYALIDSCRYGQGWQDVELTDGVSSLYKEAIAQLKALGATVVQV